jgi:putative MFS transporter
MEQEYVLSRNGSLFLSWERRYEAMSSVSSTVTTVDKVSEIIARIERLPLTSWQVRARIIVGVATFFDAFDSLAIAFVLPVLIGLWSIKPQQIGLIISAGFTGQLIGALFFGWLAERIGRLRTTVLTILVYAIFSFFCAASWSYASLLTFRMIQGFGLGGEVPVAASYINEITGARGRGRFVLLYELVFPIGLMVAALAGYWIVPRIGWRWLFVIGGVPAAIAIYLRMALPESPRWLASVGRNEEAEKAMTWVEQRIKKVFKGELREPKITPVTGGRATKITELFSGIYLRRTLVIWLIWFATYLSTYGIMTWLPSIYRTVFKLSLDQSLLYSMVANFSGLIGAFAVAMLIDKVGRRVWITVAFFGGGIFLIVLWYMGASTVVQLLVLSALAYFFFSSVSLTVYLYTPELYPTRMRALGSSVGSAWARVATMVGPFTVGMVLMHYQLSWAFLFFGFVALIAGIITGFFGVETKERLLEEVSP